MQVEILSLHVRVPLSREEFTRLVCVEHDHVASWFRRLDVADINYDGFFGEAFFCVVNYVEAAEKVAAILHKRLNSPIPQRYLDKAKVAVWQPQLVKRKGPQSICVAPSV